MTSSTSTSDPRKTSSSSRANGLRTLFLAWQDPDGRRWFPVGRLDQSNGTYLFRYTKGALQAQKRGFTPITSFPRLYKTYESEDIFPLFANQVLSRNRPEFDDFVEWLSVPKEKADPVAILARTSDQVTDTLEIFPYPEQREDDAHVVHFFVRGLRYQSDCAIKRVHSLEPGERLLMLPDVQNEHDPNACLLRTVERHKKDMHLMGYLPRYLAREMSRISPEHRTASKIEVVRVNPSPAPIHFRILCRLAFPSSSTYQPFDDEVYDPLSEQ